MKGYQELPLPMQLISLFSMIFHCRFQANANAQKYQWLTSFLYISLCLYFFRCSSKLSATLRNYLRAQFINVKIQKTKQDYFPWRSTLLQYEFCLCCAINVINNTQKQTVQILSYSLINSIHCNSYNVMYPDRPYCYIFNDYGCT